MIEIINDIFSIYDQTKPFLNQPVVKQITSDFFSWIGKKIFVNKKSAQEKLELMKEQKADTKTISDLKSYLKYELDGNEKLQKELANKLKEIKENLEKSGVQISITDNSIHQTNIFGDNVGRDQIYKKSNL